MTTSSAASPGASRGPGETASAYFGSMAEEYDSLIRRAVPRYDEMIDRLVEHLPRRAASVLELGCGTGNFTLRLAANYPEARITTVDASEEMVRLTYARLCAAGAGEDRLKLEIGRFEEIGFEAGAFDLVTSCISLHHVVDKVPFFRKLRGWIAPGGSLRFAEQMAGATEEAHEVNWTRWLEHCREPGNCSPEEIESLLEHAEAHDHYESLAAHFSYLTDAGFNPVSLDCVWRDRMWGVALAGV